MILRAWRALSFDARHARLHFFLIILAALAVSASVCNPPVQSSEISRERAIDIARGDMTFSADTIEAVRVISEGRAVWRVTFKGRLPDQPPGLFETRIVDVDARTGKILSLSTS